MKSRLAENLVVIAVLMMVAVFAFYRCQPAVAPVPPTEKIEKVTQGSVVIDAKNEVPVKTPQDALETILLSSGTNGYIEVISKELPPIPAAGQTLAKNTSDIESPDYIFIPLPGVEYKPIWFRIPQQDLKYIRL